MYYTRLGNTDMKVPVLAFGSSGIGGEFGEVDDFTSVEVLRQALAEGMTHIDTAPWYGAGKAETIIGKALKDVPRDSYTIGTKVGRYEKDVDRMFDYSEKGVIRGFDESLKRLGIDYVDIIQVHDMEYAENLDVILKETLPALLKLKQAGKARYIGITGYPLSNFRTILEKSHIHIDTVLSYCHYTMFDTSLEDMTSYLKSKGVGLINAAPMGMGLLTPQGPPSWHPATNDIVEACADASSYCLRNGVDISRLALHFTMSNKDLNTTVVSANRLDIVHKNIATIKEPLSALEKRVLRNIREKYFIPLKNKTWEGIEVSNYKRKLKESKSRTGNILPYAYNC